MADLGRGARREGTHLPQRRSVLLQDRHDARLRQAGAPRSRGHEAGRARRRGQLREGGRAGFRAVEGDQARRADLGCRRSARAGPAGTSSARRWRCGCSASRPSTSTRAASTRLSASRERDRAERGRDRASRSRASGCTSSTCSSTTRRCRSRSGTPTRFPTSSRSGFRPSAVRYLLLSAHYRKQLNFTWAGLAQAEESLRRLTDFLARARSRDRRRVRIRRSPARVEEAQHGVRRRDAGRSQHGRRARRDVRAGARRSTRRSTPARSGRATCAVIRAAFDGFDRGARRALRCAARKTRARRCRSRKSSGSSRSATPRGGAAISPRRIASGTTWPARGVLLEDSPPARAGNRK